MSQKTDDEDDLPLNPSYAEAFAFYSKCPGVFGPLVEMYSWATCRQGYFSANMDEAGYEYLQLKAEGFFTIPYG
jgi:hypothetical protein